MTFEMQFLRLKAFFVSLSLIAFSMDSSADGRIPGYTSPIEISPGGVVKGWMIWRQDECPVDYKLDDRSTKGCHSLSCDPKINSRTNWGDLREEKCAEKCEGSWAVATQFLGSERRCYHMGKMIRSIKSVAYHPVKDFHSSSHEFDGPWLPIPLNFCRNRKILSSGKPEQCYLMNCLDGSANAASPPLDDGAQKSPEACQSACEKYWLNYKALLKLGVAGSACWWKLDDRYYPKK